MLSLSMLVVIFLMMGSFAANIGLGTRILRSHIHTLGAYYDYRQTKNYHYNQISLNYENLGKRFDWRANGYLPVGAFMLQIWSCQI